MIAPIQRKDETKNTAVEGDVISFSKYGINFTGLVIAVYTNSVCVDIESYDKMPDKDHLRERTVVSHKRYKVL